jgi:hypothetical protein|tara:strand:+ start:160 stop:363 length:204 start_codon:yes stop_codon:yes gene_type:complete
MEIQFLKKFEGKIVKIILKNNFNYTAITFKITGEGLIEFLDKTNEIITIEPSFISMISELNGGERNG